MLNKIFKHLPIVSTSRRFCTTNVKIREDWEYARDISEHIKNNQINEAFRTLIRSYLDNKILDMQTYYSLYNKMEELQTQSTYKELLYKLYRQHFQPHHLMKSWMDQIVTSSDSKLKELVNLDYKKLNINDLAIKQSLEKGKKKIEQVDNEKKMGNLVGSIDEHKGLVTQVQPKPNTMIQFQQFHSMLQTLTQHSKIILHDIEISFDNDEANNQQMLQNNTQEFYQEQEEHDHDENTMDQLNLNEDDDSLSLADYLIISKIKIGKIQLIKNTDKKSPENPEVI